MKVKLNKSDWKNAQAISNLLIVAVLTIWLLIDTTNGYLINNGIYVIGTVSFGEVFRILFLVLLMLSISIKSSDVILLSVPYLLISVCLLQYLLFGNDLVTNLNIAVKVSLPILIYIFLKNNSYIFHKPHLVRKIIYVNGVILLTNLYMSYFGFGYKNYRTSLDLGGTGYFYAGNEVSGALLMLYSLILFDLRQKQKKAIIVTMLFLIAALVLTSRAAIFGTLIIFGLYLFLYKKVSKLTVAISSGLLTFFIYYFVYDYILMAINRWTYFIENTGALVFLTGGTTRWNNAQAYLQELMEAPFYLLIGKGWLGFAEQDLLDLLMAYGMLGLTVYAVWIYWGFNIYKKLNVGPSKKYALLVIYFILAIATFAGHIVQSAMIAPFIALFANLSLLNKGSIGEGPKYENYKA